MSLETVSTTPLTPESQLETPVFITQKAVVWEQFEGQEIAITALIRGASGEIVQYHRTEWACFILGAKVNEFTLEEDEPENVELAAETYLRGGMSQIDQPELTEGYWAEAESLRWQSAQASQQPPFIALLARVRTAEGEVTMPLRDWHSGLTPQQQNNFNLYQLYR